MRRRTRYTYGGEHRSWPRTIGAGALVVAVIAVFASLAVARASSATEREVDVVLVRLTALQGHVGTAAGRLERSSRARTRAVNEQVAARLLSKLLRAPSHEVAGLELRGVRPQVKALEHLLDDIPASLQSIDVTVARASRERVDDARAVSVDGSVTVRFPISANPDHPHAVRVDAHMVPGGDPSSELIQRWKLERASVTRLGLFRLPDPQVLQGLRVTVVADRAFIDAARVGFEWAEANFAPLSARYVPLEGHRRIAVLYASTARERGVIMSGAGLGEVDAAGVHTSLGEIGLVLDAGSSSPLDSFGILDIQTIMQHELTHAVTDGFTYGTPQGVVEGVAEYEQHRAIVSAGGGSIGLGWLAVDFRDGTLDVARLMTVPGSFRDDGFGRYVDYQASAVAIHVLEERFGHRRVVAYYRRFERPVDPEEALQASFGIGSRELARAARAWVRTNPAWSG